MQGYRRFRRRPCDVWARQVTEPTEVMTTGGRVTAVAGEWIVQEEQTVFILSDRLFKLVYEPDLRHSSGLYPAGKSG